MKNNSLYERVIWISDSKWRTLISVVTHTASETPDFYKSSMWWWEIKSRNRSLHIIDRLNGFVADVCHPEACSVFNLAFMYWQLSVWAWELRAFLRRHLQIACFAFFPSICQSHPASERDITGGFMCENSLFKSVYFVSQFWFIWFLTILWRLMQMLQNEQSFSVHSFNYVVIV